MSAPTLPAPPGHLTKPARELFTSIVERYELEDEELATLTLALEAWVHAGIARRRLKNEGQYVTDRFGQLRPHPAVTVHRDCLATWTRLLTQLGIPTDDGGSQRDLRGQFTGRGRRRGKA